MNLTKFWLKNNMKKRKKVSKKNIEADEETTKQIKDLIKVYNIMYQILRDDPDNNTLDSLKKTLKILEQNKKIEKDKEDTKTEFDVWFNSRK